MEPGIYHDIPFDEYLSIPAVSSSCIRAGVLEGLDSMRAAYVGRDDKDSKAKRLGRAAHSLYATPTLFAKQWLRSCPCQELLKSGERKGEACKATSCAYVEHEDDQVWLCGMHVRGKANVVRPADYLSPLESECVDQMAVRMRRVPVLNGKGHGEVTIVFVIEGVLCKVRLDWWRPTDISDIKTTEYYPLIETMERAVGSSRMDIQAQLYRNAVYAMTGEWLPFNWVFQQSTGTFATNWMQADDETLEFAQQEITMTLRNWKRCVTNGVYPDPFDSMGKPYVGGLPSYIRKQYIDQSVSDITFGGEPLYASSES